ncbi:glucokinase [Marinithermofilum abyssi]|uniref:Glucokinase n=1 Tax=Marinithermofilum abyssi TaxID=1571185 RepID=A0A8J2VEU7_9BACL|nr:ROK family protein [Marinithermofilum abyssi]GGE26311.1 glucokinase [Marinithermofilum abyssi]
MGVIGVDVGGTKIAAAWVDETGACSGYTVLPSVTREAEAMLNQVDRCIREVLRRENRSLDEVEGVGIGIPGKVDRERGIAVYQNNLPWRDFLLVTRLQETFPVPMLLENDVHAAAFGEWAFHGGNSEELMVYVTISTGLACCIIQEGEALTGAGFAGEIGLVPVVPDGQRLEERTAGPAIASRMQQAAGGSWTTAQVMAAWKQEDVHAKRVMDAVLDEWAQALYTVICLLDPHRLVLGGGVILPHPELLSEIGKRVESHAHPAQRGVSARITGSRLQHLAGCVGAGRLCLQRAERCLPPGGSSVNKKESRSVSDNQR